MCIYVYVNNSLNSNLAYFVYLYLHIISQCSIKFCIILYHYFDQQKIHEIFDKLFYIMWIPSYENWKINIKGSIIFLHIYEYM